MLGISKPVSWLARPVPFIERSDRYAKVDKSPRIIDGHFSHTNGDSPPEKKRDQEYRATVV
jgi:hypothetical protein